MNTDNKDHTTLKNLAARTAAALGVETFPLVGKAPAPVHQGGAIYAWGENLTRKAGVHEATAYAWEHATGYAVKPLDTLSILDVDDLSAFDELTRTIPELTNTLTIETGSGGLHVYFHAPTPLPNLSLSRDGHEVMSLRTGQGGAGRYVVGAGSTHPNGKPYRVIRDTLPAAITPQASNKLVGMFDQGKTARPKPQIMAFPSLPHNQELNRTQHALNVLDPGRADDYETWLKVGMGLKAGHGDAGFTLWEQWSAKSPKFKPGECERKWAGFRRTGITLATVYDYADQDRPGWRDEFFANWRKAARPTSPQNGAGIGSGVKGMSSDQESPQAAPMPPNGGLCPIPASVGSAALRGNEALPLAVYLWAAGEGRETFTAQDLIAAGFKKASVYELGRIENSALIVVKGESPKSERVFDPGTKGTVTVTSNRDRKTEKSFTFRTLPLSEVIRRLQEREFYSLLRFFYPLRRVSDLIPAALVGKLSKALPDDQREGVRLSFFAALSLQDNAEERSTWKAFTRALHDHLEALTDPTCPAALPLAPFNGQDFRIAWARVLHGMGKRGSYQAWSLMLGVRKGQVKTILERAGIEGQRQADLVEVLPDQGDPVRAAYRASKGRGKAIALETDQGEVIYLDRITPEKRLDLTGQRLSVRIKRPNDQVVVRDVTKSPKRKATTAPKRAEPGESPKPKTKRAAPAPKPTLTAEQETFRDMMLVAAAKLDQGGKGYKGYSRDDFPTVEAATELFLMCHEEYQKRQAPAPDQDKPNKPLPLPEALDLRQWRAVLRRTVKRFAFTEAAALGMTRAEALSTWGRLAPTEQAAVLSAITTNEPSERIR